MRSGRARATGQRRAAVQRWRKDFQLRRYHDRVLSYGSPPVRFVRQLMFDEPIR